MNKKEKLSNIKTENIYSAIEEAGADTQEEEKVKPYNFSISNTNKEYLKLLSTMEHKTMSKLLNEILDEHRLNNKNIDDMVETWKASLRG